MEENWESKRKKTKKTQNWQKIEPYGSLATKEIKKKHSSRPVGGVETGSWAERTHGKAVAGGPSKVADCGAGWAELQLAREAAAGGPGDRPHNPEFQRGEIKSQTTDWKHLWGLRHQREKLPASQESSLERPTGSKNMHKPTHSRISTRRAKFDCGEWREWLKTGREWSKRHCSLSDPSPT